MLRYEGHAMENNSIYDLQSQRAVTLNCTCVDNERAYVHMQLCMCVCCLTMFMKRYWNIIKA